MIVSTLTPALRCYEVVPFAKGTEMTRRIKPETGPTSYEVVPFAKGTEIRSRWWTCLRSRVTKLSPSRRGLKCTGNHYD